MFIFGPAGIVQTFLGCGTHFWWDVIHLKVVRGDDLCLLTWQTWANISLGAAALEELEVGIIGIEAVVERGHIAWKH